MSTIAGMKPRRQMPPTPTPTPWRRVTISAAGGPSRPRPTPQRRVTISEFSQMVYVTDLSVGSDKPDIWFTPDEMESFKDGAQSHLRVVQILISLGNEPSASNILGMEKLLTPRLAEEYRNRKARLFADVVDEARWQEEQIRRASWSRKKEDHLDFFSRDLFVERLARTAAEGSKWARERARAAALFLDQDQEEEREAERKAEREAEREAERKAKREAKREVERRFLAALRRGREQALAKSGAYAPEPDETRSTSFLDEITPRSSLVGDDSQSHGQRGRRASFYT